ncbi:hypothetical protein DZB84_19105 [Bacillus sp. HNG]|nr:hypothetical protein DZB84_19105 [Bacillus sp. HNG]
MHFQGRGIHRVVLKGLRIARRKRVPEAEIILPRLINFKLRTTILLERRKKKKTENSFTLSDLMSGRVEPSEGCMRGLTIIFREPLLLGSLRIDKFLLFPRKYNEDQY